MLTAKYSDAQGDEFLDFARKVLEVQFSGEEIKVPDKLHFRQARGVFVTLTKKSKLRGCVGFPHASYSLGDAIKQSVKAAAFEDFRFPPVIGEEVKNLKIEISVLTEPYEIEKSDDWVKKIEIGKDGLICKYLGYSGLLLPQVATENKMSKLEFLEAVCQKAGIPKDSWQNPNTKFYKFHAQIFKEK